MRYSTRDRLPELEAFWCFAYDHIHSAAVSRGSTLHKFVALYGHPNTPWRYATPEEIQAFLAEEARIERNYP